MANWLVRLAANPRFHAWVNRVPLLRQFAKQDGIEVFRIVQGFVTSQVLFALVSLGIPRLLLNGALPTATISRQVGIQSEKLILLLRAAVAIGVLKGAGKDKFGLTRKGAVICGVPGLHEMILHHEAFYRDMANPLSVLKGEADTELATVWPYVFGGSEGIDPAVAKNYSTLMAESQKLVAADTLRAVNFSGIRRLMDVGGGTGAFLIELAVAEPQIELMLFDLPSVEPAAVQRISAANLADRISLHWGSFRNDPLPSGADAISLIRVLYDHRDETVAELLRVCFAALPPDGRLIISEPMSGGVKPDPITDVYFAFYTLAMRTGRTRSADEISALVRNAGFSVVRCPASSRPFVTSSLTAVKPS